MEIKLINGHNQIIFSENDKKEIANQFVKFLILPVNYQLMWIETKSQEKIKRKMWCVLRNQNS